MNATPQLAKASSGDAILGVSTKFGASSCRTLRGIVGEWLSLVEHLVRDQGVGGSNPLSPTNYLFPTPKGLNPPCFWAANLCRNLLARHHPNFMA